jgi:hypothetical protein
MAVMAGLNDLRDQGRMTWSERARGWVGPLREILGALEDDGFDECKCEMTTSRRDSFPACGVWQGVNSSTGSVASAVWVNRQKTQGAMVFIEIDGESITRPGRDPDEEEGGEG